MLLLSSRLSALLVIYFVAITTALPLPLPIKDSPIQTIIVPYHSSVVAGMPYQYPATPSVARHVLVPQHTEMAPRFELDAGAMAMSSVKGMPVNFVDGAYPVYYMPGNANGRFNGKISLLD